MSWLTDLQETADTLFDLAGEPVVYRVDGFPCPVSAIVRALSVDDMPGEHVMADAIVCQIRESELRAGFVSEDPARGDTITRLVDDGFVEQVLEVVERRRDPSGVWTLFCQKAIRVTP